MTSQECVGATRSYTNMIQGMRLGAWSSKLKFDANTSIKVSLEKSKTAGNKE
jgi:hypothetical protein